MKALDLFCGAGGSAKGLQQAGFDVRGIDIKEGLNYPYHYDVADAVEVLRSLVRGEKPFGLEIETFDFIWASPPCQKFSAYRRKDPNKVGAKAPDLIGPVRELLNELGLPYIIENVEGSPLQDDAIKLCGSMFGLDVRRHRLFECSFPIKQPKCDHALHRARGRRFPPATNRPNKRFTCEIGVWRIPIEKQYNAMGGCEWMELTELSQAIPPAYSQWLAEQFIADHRTDSVGRMEQLSLTL